MSAAALRFWRSDFLLSYRRSRTASASAVVLLLMVLVALMAPLLAPSNPYDLAGLDLMDSRLAPGAVGGDGRVRLLGTDEQGRDLLSAILYGLRISLSVGITATVIALTLGTLVGITAAFFGGKTETLLMRLVDFQLSFPAILLALILVAALKPGVGNIVIALVAVQWAYYARTSRSVALVERKKEYMDAVRGLGLSPLRAMLRHLLPNCAPSLMVVASLQVASAISLEATLSFLGLGVPITEPSLGLLIANGQQQLMSGRYWMAFFPGLVLLVLVMSINLVADQLRDVLNPRLAQR